MLTKSLGQSLSETSITDRIIAIFTIVLAVVGISEVLIYREQLLVNRIDERAWEGIAARPVAISGNDTSGYTVGFPILVFNNGKTPALRVYAEFVSDIYQADQAPIFIYDRSKYTDVTGILQPTQTDNIVVPLLGGMKSGPRTLSASEMRGLKEGKTYLVVYGKTTYVDIFGAHHWDHFCYWQAINQGEANFQARSCTEYNDVDRD